MSHLAPIIGVVQIIIAIVVGIYFWSLLRSQRSNKVAVKQESYKEMDQLRKMREISLTEPLSEKTRPTSFTEIVGQEEGVKALRQLYADQIHSMLLFMALPVLARQQPGDWCWKRRRKTLLHPLVMMLNLWSWMLQRLVLMSGHCRSFNRYCS